VYWKDDGMTVKIRDTHCILLLYIMYIDKNIKGMDFL